MHALADFLNAGGHNRSAILRMTKLEMHTSANVSQFQHRSTPGRARDRHQYWFRTVLWMPGNQRLAFPQEHGGVTMMLGLDLQHGRRRQVSERNATLNF